MLLILLGQANP